MSKKEDQKKNEKIEIKIGGSDGIKVSESEIYGLMGDDF